MRKATPLKILIIEDYPIDAELLVAELRRNSVVFESIVVDNRIDYVNAINRFNPDPILSDYFLPLFDGMEALEIRKVLAPDVPFILTTGHMNEMFAVEVMKAGADDYILKNNLNRLVPAIHNALEQGQIRKKQRAAELALRESEMHFRMLADGGQAMIWLSGPDGRITYFNQPWMNFAGRPLEEELGNGWITRIHPDDQASRLEKYSKMFNLRQKGSAEYRLRHCSGEYRWLLEDWTPRYNSLGEFCVFMGQSLDITRQKQSEEEIKRYNDKLRGLTAHLEKVREEERRNLARDIHDVMGVSLSSLKMELKVLQNNIADHCSPLFDHAVEHVDKMSATVDDVISLMRNLVKELRPEILDHLGLAETVRWYCGEVSRRSGIEFVVTIFPREIRMNAMQSIVLFRIIQEILTNIVRHSRATKATVFIKKSKQSLIMRIADNGIGLSDHAIHKEDAFGILSIRERVALLNGVVEIVGPKGKGTTVSLTIPAKTRLSDPGA